MKLYSICDKSELGDEGLIALIEAESSDEAVEKFLENVDADELDFKDGSLEVNTAPEIWR